MLAISSTVKQVSACRPASRQAALDGQGFAFIGPPLIEKFLSNGSLIQPVDAPPVVRHAFHLLLPEMTLPSATMAWSKNSGYKYVTVYGHAMVSNDRSTIERLWEKTDKVWRDNAQDPEIRLITVVPDEAELWDSPGKLVATAKMVMAAVTGTQPDVGENAKVNPGKNSHHHEDVLPALSTVRPSPQPTSLPFQGEDVEIRTWAENVPGLL